MCLYQVYQQFRMRYNSLRSQLNWHSRQQTHIFKKINKNSHERQPSNLHPPEDDHHLKGHQLIWLEKMMKELHHYKEEVAEKETNIGKIKDEPVVGILREKSSNACKEGKGNTDKQKKVSINLEDNGKSAKKIKFQIVINQDKGQSAKKICVSQHKPKTKSSKKLPSKTVPKKTVTQRSTINKQAINKEIIKDVNNSCPSNTKVIEVQNIKTDPYSFKEADIQILQQLWKKQSQQAVQPENKLSSKKSIGKIIKNSDKLNKTCIQMNKKQSKQANQLPTHGASCNTNPKQNSSYKQYKQSKHKASVSIHSFQSKQLTPQQVKDTTSNQFKSLPSVEKAKEGKMISRPEQIKIPQQKARYEKIYIKLETEKLSQYLLQRSEVKVNEEAKDKIIETGQYEKYCVTKRVEKPIINSYQVENNQKKSLTAQKKLNEYSNQAKIKQQNAPRTKSQQRKLNKMAQNIRPTKLFEVEATPKQSKYQHKAVQQSGVFLKPNVTESKQKQSESRIQIKLKRRYEYKQEEPQSQKLFTLHSVSSDSCSQQEHQSQYQQPSYHQYQQPSKQPQLKKSNIIKEQSQYRPSLSIEFQSQPLGLTNVIHQSIQYCQTNPSNKQQSQTHLSQSVFKQSLVVKDSQVKNDYTEQLTLLFKFLDQGHRGLLTDTNCLYESLTQQLKLLFSVILNQIRTKKRFYNLQKFIEESKQILQIKNQVYNSNNKTSQNQNMVYQILRQNLDILKKKLPLMFVKCTYTQSCFDNSNLQSRRNSVSYGQSFVVDKIEIDNSTIRRQPQENIVNKSHATPSVNKQLNNFTPKNSDFDLKWTERRQKDKQNLQKYQQCFRKSNKKMEEHQMQLDVMQPQIFLQKKYGFSKDQQQSSQKNSKVNSMFLKTRGYLQNLDNYIKIR